MRTPLKNKTADLCLLLVACLAGLSLCEISLRLFYPKYRHLVKATSSRDEWRYNRRTNSRDETAHVDTLIPHGLHHNNLGLRQHRNHSEADLTAATNIGVFGDSFTENVGIDAPYSFTEPLDYLLNQSGHRFNVLNFGVEGWGTDRSLLRYAHYPDVEDLDHVFYAYYSNDLEDIYRSGLFHSDGAGHLTRSEVLRASWWVPLISRLHVSYLILDAAGHISSLLEETATNKNPRIDSCPLNENEKSSLAIFRQLIRRWKSLVETHANTFSVVTIPDDRYPCIHSLLREEGVEVLNLYDCFMDHDPGHARGSWYDSPSPYRFETSFHWNEAGNHLAAVCLYRFLEKKAKLPRLSEDRLQQEIYRYYSAFGGWSPTDLGGGGVSPQTLAGIREKYQAFDEPNLFEARWRALLAAPDKRIIEADYDIYSDGNALVYLKEGCFSTNPGLLKFPRFFLHMTPVEGQNIPKHRRRRSFSLRSRLRKVTSRITGSVLPGNRCLLVQDLPPYPLRSIQTGQYVPDTGRLLWARKYSFEQQRSSEAVMEPMPSERRIICSTYDVYLDGKTLVYAKEDCGPADKEATFFLQVTPVDPRILAPDGRPRQGFDTEHFNRCTMEVELPTYDIRHIRTGQFVRDERRLWEGEFTIGPAHTAEGAPKGGFGSKPIIQSDYDVFLREGRLIYKKERCGSTDTSAMVFLHVTPVDNNELGPERRHHGFANLDHLPQPSFRIDEFGCRTSYRLPSYAIRRIRTGQYVPGEEGLLWEGEFSFD